jgi:hypothetical protein
LDGPVPKSAPKNFSVTAPLLVDDPVLLPLDPQPATAASAAAATAAIVISRDFIRSPHSREGWSPAPVDVAAASAQRARSVRNSSASFCIAWADSMQKATLKMIKTPAWRGTRYLR